MFFDNSILRRAFEGLAKLIRWSIDN